MTQLRQTGQVLYLLGVSLFVAALLAGLAQSFRVDHKPPSIDLFENGSREYINDLLANRDYGGAIRQLELQARLIPFEPSSYEHLGNILGSQGRTLEARAQFKKLIELRPNYAEAYRYLGSTYLQTGQPGLAAANFEKAIRLKPDFPIAINNLGLAMAEQGNLIKAEQCFAKAVELAPDYENARQNLERARRELGTRP